MAQTDAPPQPTAQQAAETRPDKPDKPKPLHTPGGLPAVPALTTAASATAAALSTTTLAAGPVALGAAAVAVAGAAAVAVVRKARGKAGSKPASRTPAAPNRTPAVPNRPTAGHSGVSKRPSTPPRQLTRTAELGAHRRKAAEQRRTTPAAEQRGKLTQQRRSVADARRDAKRAAADSRRQPGQLDKPSTPSRPDTPGRPGAPGRPDKGGQLDESGLRHRVRTAADKVRSTSRGAVDKARERKADATKSKLTAEAATGPLKSALRRSAVRHAAAKARAGLAAGVTALVTAPVAWMLRKPVGAAAGWVWRKLTARAAAKRAERDAKAHAEHGAEQQERPDLPTHDDVATPAQIREHNAAVSAALTHFNFQDLVYSPGKTWQQDFNVTNTPWNSQEDFVLFDFTGSAEEMHAKAQGAEITGMLAVLASVESFPDAIGYMAASFAAVAEKCSPGEAPLDPAVSDAINEVYGLLQQAAEASADIAQTFRSKHEAEIERLENPRPNESAWDLGANQDDV